MLTLKIVRRFLGYIFLFHFMIEPRTEVKKN